MRNTMLKGGVSLLAIATMAIFTAAPASAGDYNNDNYEAGHGFYIGGFGGYGWTDAETDVGPDFDVNGGDYGAFVGYELGKFLDGNNAVGLYGAIEGYYTWSDADDTVGGVTVEKDNEWGVNFRPGFTFIDRHSPFGLKPYGIVGYRQTEFETSSALGSTDENFDGFELGLGTELIAYQDFGVRVDYTHVFYEEKGGLDPDEDNIRVGLAYHF